VTNSDAERTSRGGKRAFRAAVVAIVALGLAGCESSGSSLFSSLSSSPETSAPEPARQAPQAMLANIALAPVIGAPDAVSRQMAEQIIQSAERQRIRLINDRDAKGDYTLRGYIVASKDRSQTKVSYIWDLTDPTGKRVNRVTGEELVPAGAAKDPWQAVTGAVTQSIADKTTGQLASWLQANHRPSGAAPMSGAPPSYGQPIAAARPRAEPASANTTTASLQPMGEVAAIIPAVSGAPGDGNTALSSALQRELSRQGVTMANRPGASYRIEGKVVVGPAQAGKQSIQIDWLVRDPQGRSLGTVSQKNEIPEGSLDGTWGNTADAAAGAAAQGIIKLLPQPARAVN
jgi:Mrp family chromosome partitioning ATPase